MFLKCPKNSKIEFENMEHWGLLGYPKFRPMDLHGPAANPRDLCDGAVSIHSLSRPKRWGSRSTKCSDSPNLMTKNRPTSFINVHQAPSLGPFAGLLNPAAQTNTIFQGVSGNVNETVSDAKIIPVESFCEDLEGITLKVLVAGCKQMLLEKPLGKLVSTVTS